MDQPSEFQFSAGARAVLDRASSMALESKRAGITTSCLLFAFAERAHSVPDVAGLVKEALNHTKGGYDGAYRAFLRDAGDPLRHSAAAVEGLGRMSENMRNLLEGARDIARRCSRSVEIHSRHLFAAMLVLPETGRPLTARQRLKDLGVDFGAIIHRLREFLRAQVASDNQQEWDAVLGTTPPAQQPGTKGGAAPAQQASTGSSIIAQTSDRIPLVSARNMLSLDEPALEFLTHVSATARRIERPVDSFAALSLLMGWAETGTDYAASAITQALRTKNAKSTEASQKSPAELLGLRSDYVPKEPDPIEKATLSTDLLEILRATHECVARMSEEGFLRFRVLLVIIFSKKSLAGGNAAVKRLRELGYNLDQVRALYRRWLAKNRADDPAPVYDEQLGTVEECEQILGTGPQPVPAVDAANPFRPTYAAYNTDLTAYSRRTQNAPLEDALGVGVYAGHLAQLIAAKETLMPLSIGLFGAWGAGKSYFIDLIDERLRTLAANPGKAFHQQIVQIRFNAWHYLDTNLWANLVSEIFDQLFAKLGESKQTTETQVDNLKRELAKQSALAAEAHEALKAAEAARIKAETDLRTAMKERAKAAESVSALLEDLTSLVKNDPAVQEQLRAASDGLGLPKLQTSFAELEARAGEVRSLAGRLRAMVLASFTGPGWWLRGLLLVAALVLPLGTAWLASDGPDWIKNTLAGAGRLIAQLVTGIAALSTWIFTQVQAGNSVVAKLESAYEKVKKARAAREATDDAAKMQAELAKKQQAEEEARHVLHEAEERKKVISAELAELAPGRQLIRFLKDRASAEDYRRHLGLVSLVRKDFEQLSQLLTKAGADKKELPKVDRIVLYIDDLDRCRADRVIEVLEAVHLLLAFPLFAVVVAVDPRWLRQSLLDHYAHLLGAEADAAKKQAKALGRAATPQDYLEKVFQVPFHLQPMEKTGFDMLVSQLFPVGTRTIKKEPPVPGDSKPPETVPPDAPPPADPNVELPAVDPAKSPPGGKVEPPPQDEEAKKSPPPPPPDPERLDLTAKEVKDVQKFQPLFQTPRAVKRLANTYCLIRVGVSADDWDAYVGTKETPGNYRVPLLMLAVTSAFPALARPWLIWLQEMTPDEWQLAETEIDTLAAKHADTTDKADWERLGRGLERLKSELNDWKPDAKLVAKWSPRVARYSF